MGRTGSGLEIRESSIRIEFTLKGERIRERFTINGKAMSPTPANIKYATRAASEIKRRISLGTFDYAEFFPDSPRVIKADPTTFGNLADLWLKSKGQLEAATVDQYTNAVGIWKRLLGDTSPITDLTYQKLSATVGGHPWASAKLANNYLIVLRGIFDFQYSGRKAADNPMIGIKNLKVVKKLPDPLTADERDAILARLGSKFDPRLTAYFATAFYTGMRPEELIALKWSDIDFNTKMLRVQRVKTFRGTERDGSKTHTERDVDLVASAIQALTDMKPFTYLKSEYVFENPVTGKPWHDERSQRDHYWTPTLKHLGIRHRRAYNTRHTYATVALMGGVNPAYIARQLGHASTKMLFEKYARWVDGADKGDARARMEAAQNSPQIPPTEKTGST